MTSIAAKDVLSKKLTSNYNSNFRSEVSQHWVHRVLFSCEYRVALNNMSGNGSSLISRVYIVSNMEFYWVCSNHIDDSTAHRISPVLNTVHVKAILSPVHTPVTSLGVVCKVIVAGEITIDVANMVVRHHKVLRKSSCE